MKYGKDLIIEYNNIKKEVYIDTSVLKKNMLPERYFNKPRGIVGYGSF